MPKESKNKKRGSEKDNEKDNKKENRDRNTENRRDWFGEFKKAPGLKMEKLRMEDIDDIEELVAKTPEEIMAPVKKPQPGGNYPRTDFSTVKELVTYAVNRFPDNVLILDKEKPRDKEWKEYTYARFGHDVGVLGAALTGRYMDQGDPIVIIGENSYEWCLSYVTALFGAGIAVPLDKELPVEELELTINRSRATVVIYSSRLKSRFKKLMDDGKLPAVRHFIEMKSDEEEEGRHVGFRHVMLEGEAIMEGGGSGFLDIETDPDAFSALFFTSGTTAAAKGVMASTRQLANNINAVSAYVRLTEDHRFFSVLPLHHTYESSIGFLLVFLYGTSIAICQGLKYITDNMKDTHPTVLIAVPLLIGHLYDAIRKNIKKSGKEKLVAYMMQATNALKKLGKDVKHTVFREIYDGLGGRLSIIVSAAAPVDPKVAKWFTDLGILFLQGYGLTETCPISAVTPDFDPRYSSGGRTILNGVIKVDDPDEKGEGELLISTDTLMIGYYEDEEATREAVFTDEDGRSWFRSGDVGRVDEDGFVYLTGRIKSVIVTQNGKNIYPEELEMLLSDIDIISECMVYGRESSEKNDLVITARVIPDEEVIRERYGDISIDEKRKLIMKEIRKVNDRTTNYKAIKALEIKDGPFIKTTTQKIKRFAEIAEGKIIPE